MGRWSKQNLSHPFQGRKFINGDGRPLAKRSSVNICTVSLSTLVSNGALHYPFYSQSCPCLPPSSLISTSLQSHSQKSRTTAPSVWKPRLEIRELWSGPWHQILIDIVFPVCVILRRPSLQCAQRRNHNTSRTLFWKSKCLYRYRPEGIFRIFFSLILDPPRYICFYSEKRQIHVYRPLSPLHGLFRKKRGGLVPVYVFLFPVVPLV